MKSQIEESVEMIQNGQSDRHDLTKKVNELAVGKLKSFRTAWEYTDFIALANVLNLPRDEVLSEALKEAYVKAAIEPPHLGVNIALGLPEFVDGMRDLGVNDKEVADYIAKTLEYRVVEGSEYGTIVECVAIPFVKSGIGKTTVGEALQGLQNNATNFKANEKSSYPSSWNREGKARQIENLFREHRNELYELARLNEEMDSAFDYWREVSPWREKTKVRDPNYQWKTEIRPEILSDEGREGQYKRLLIRQRRLMNQIGIEDTDHRAVQLARLDIVLNSDVITGATGKTGGTMYHFYDQMLKFAQVLGASDDFIAQIRTKAKERYSVNL